MFKGSAPSPRMGSRMFFVYLLKSEKDGKLYIGYTNNLKRRLEEHTHGLSKATKPRGNLTLVYYESYKSRRDAVFREKQLKRFSQAYTALKQRIENSIA